MTVEPMAWYRDEDGVRMYYDKQYFDDAKPLYSAQREWVGLTDDEVADLRDNTIGLSDLILAVEAKLKEKNT